MCWVWSYFKTCMQWKDIEYLTKVYIREDGQWLGVNQCLYLRGPSANPVSGIANCRQHILQHTLYTLYSDNWKTVTLQHVLCSTVLAAALDWDNWNNWQWPILALWSTPSQPPILNFHFYSTESVNPSPISWYVTSLLIIRELPAHDLILTCAFPLSRFAPTLHHSHFNSTLVICCQVTWAERESEMLPNPELLE